jgi:glycosyltransferase involved in cell wall biosynthesis
MSLADVTICIPAWNAERFIERTLSYATGQTYRSIRILVSIDRSDDGTEAICRSQARQDPRIDVRVQTERLGWSENANFLLDHVDTEFCFLYFHDDIIEPTYTERLRETLLNHPEARSVHCDLQRFGDKDGILTGNSYDGTVTERLVDLLVGPVRGAPLRSLLRSELIAQGLRFPGIAGDASGFWRCQPFLMRLIAAGPALRVPEVLYRRWFREGSLTATWHPDGQDALIDGQPESAKFCLEIIKALNIPEAERQLLCFCLYIFMVSWTRRYELRLKSQRLVKPEVISEAFPTARLPNDTSSLDPKYLEWVLRAHAKLLSMENKHAREQGVLPAGRE